MHFPNAGQCCPPCHEDAEYGYGELAQREMTVDGIEVFVDLCCTRNSSVTDDEIVAAARERVVQFRSSQVSPPVEQGSE